MKKKHKKEVWNKRIAHPSFVFDPEKSELTKTKEHIMVSCELAGLAPNRIDEVMDKHYVSLKEYTHIRPVVLADMLPKLLRRLET